jgi:RNA polymerase sigma factor (sigma-70 family)
MAVYAPTPTCLPKDGTQLAFEGRDERFEEIFKRHHAPLLAYCRHMLGNREEAEDALQQAFLRAHRAFSRGTGPREVRPWLYAIARNCCLSAIAARRPVAALDDRQAALAGLSEQVHEREDLRELVSDIGRLPEAQRSALLLAELEDLDHRAIARVVGCPVSKVKALVFQARTTLIAQREARDASCQEIREQLATARGGELRRGPLRRHLSLCAGCRDFQSAVAAQRQSLALVLPVLPSAGLALRVLGATHAGAGGASGVLGGGTGGAGGGLTTGGGGITASATGTSAITTSATTVATGTGTTTATSAGVLAGATSGTGTSALLGGGVLAKLAVGGAVAALATAGAVIPHHFVRFGARAHAASRAAKAGTATVARLPSGAPVSASSLSAAGPGTAPGPSNSSTRSPAGPIPSNPVAAQSPATAPGVAPAMPASAGNQAPAGGQASTVIPGNSAPGPGLHPRRPGAGGLHHSRRHRLRRRRHRRHRLRVRRRPRRRLHRHQFVPRPAIQPAASAPTGMAPTGTTPRRRRRRPVPVVTPPGAAAPNETRRHTEAEKVQSGGPSSGGQPGKGRGPGRRGSTGPGGETKGAGTETSGRGGKPGSGQSGSQTAGGGVRGEKGSPGTAPGGNPGTAQGAGQGHEGRTETGAGNAGKGGTGGTRRHAVTTKTLAQTQTTQQSSSQPSNLRGWQTVIGAEMPFNPGPS